VTKTLKFEAMHGKGHGLFGKMQSYMFIICNENKNNNQYN
jgi:hypothetical protein